MPDWDAIAAIGEVVGALGVIVTLGFLAFQIRQNTRALKAESFNNVAERISLPTTLIIQDADVAAIHARGNEDFDSLDPTEQERYHYLIIQRLQAIQLLTHYENSGMTPAAFMQSGGVIVPRLAAKPGFRQWWRQRGSALFSGDDFHAWIESMVESDHG